MQEKYEEIMQEVDAWMAAIDLNGKQMEDVIHVTRGENRIKRDGQGRRIYAKDAGGRLWTEYEPEGLDWYDTDANALKQIPVEEGLVGIANTPARVILQTFSDESLARLKTAFPRRITNIKRQSIENKELALFFSLNFAKLAPDLYQ